MENIWQLFLAGAFGALIKEIVVDNTLQLPKKIDGVLCLGFLGSLVIGAFVGWAIDGSLITAALAGFAGFSVLEKLIPQKKETPAQDKNVVPPAR